MDQGNAGGAGLLGDKICESGCHQSRSPTDVLVTRKAHKDGSCKTPSDKKPLHDGEGGWKAKARVVVCGNFEPGSIAKDLENRAEVPSTFEMRTLLTLGGLGGRARVGFPSQPEHQASPWSVGSLDVKTAFCMRSSSRKKMG